MKTNQRICSLCTWGVSFQPRADEPSGQGCRKPGWEGYTSDANPACGGALFMPVPSPADERNALLNHVAALEADLLPTQDALQHMSTRALRAEARADALERVREAARETLEDEPIDPEEAAMLRAKRRDTLRAALARVAALGATSFPACPGRSTTVGAPSPSGSQSTTAPTPWDSRS